MALIRDGKLVGLTELKRIVKADIIVQHQKDADNEIGQGAKGELSDKFWRLFPVFSVFREQGQDEKVGQGNGRTAAKGEGAEETSEKGEKNAMFLRMIAVDGLYKKEKTPYFHAYGGGDGGTVQGGSGNAVPDAHDAERGRQGQIQGKGQIFKKELRQFVKQRKNAADKQQHKDLCRMVSGKAVSGDELIR